MSDDPTWRKSSRCGTSACVEVAKAGDMTLVRDGKQGKRAPVLTFDRQAWSAFTTWLASGTDHA